jgi:hypothetical protein
VTDRAAGNTDKIGKKERSIAQAIDNIEEIGGSPILPLRQ